MSTRGHICPWHEISLLRVELRVERVDYLFKNQKHDYTITSTRIDNGPFASSHLVLFTWNILDLHKKVAWLSAVSARLDYSSHKTHIHINYILFLLLVLPTAEPEICLRHVWQKAPKNYLKIERKNKKQTKHSLVIQLYLANSRMNNTMIISCEIAQVLMDKSC